MSRSLGLALLGAGLMTACSDDVVRAPAQADAGTGGAAVAASAAGPGSGGEGAGVPAAPAVEAVTAPDQTSIRVRFNVDVGKDVPASAEAYGVTSKEVAALVVESTSYDAAARELTLTTERQKLGAAYTLVIAAPGTALDAMGGDFVAADTARFWAADFGSPDYDDYELVADRVAVGENVVVYIEQGQSSVGVSEAVQKFDDEIYPKETSLLHAADDVDDNGRIVLLGLDGGAYYGGYFSPVNTLKDDEVFKEWGYHSNETDMVYINVGYASFEYDHVLPHEFSHLLYHAEHGWQTEDWSWHNEGLAECAVHVVNGSNPYAVQTVVYDASGDIGKGLSLVQWQFGNYDQYALAYMFWTYLAAQKSGSPDGYGSLFDLGGAPDDIDAWTQAHLGKTLAEAQRDFMIAEWIQAPAGPQGFAGMVDFLGEQPPRVPFGFASVDLPPYAGVFFDLDVDSIDYPGDQGPHILYAGVDGADQVDLEAPFQVANGALVVLNTNPEPENPASEPTGPNLLPPPPPLAKATSPKRDPAWLHPPPFDPRRLETLHAWQLRTAP